MGSKNKTVSFRVNEDTFESLREIAEERDLSLSAVFRDYVDTLVAHDGRVQVVPEPSVEGVDDEFPPTVEVSKGFVREHERLELENRHLREQLDEHKRFIGALRERLEERDVDEVIHLDDIDADYEDASDRADEREGPYRLG